MAKICLELSEVHAFWLLDHLNEFSSDLEGELDLIPDEEDVDDHWFALVAEKVMADQMLFKLRKAGELRG